MILERQRCTSNYQTDQNEKCPTARPSPTSPRRSARGLAKAAIAGKVNGKVVDVYAPVSDDAKIEIVTPKSEAGLDTIRHSTAHLMAMAVQELFPGTQVTIGPVIENGFFYDFGTDRPFTDDDLRRIEEKMPEIVEARPPRPPRGVEPRTRPSTTFEKLGEKYKVEIIKGIPGDEPLSVYRQGEWFDLCRGPHVPSTGHLGAFKLTSVAGAYWRGDERNAMLQRIYGTAWADKEELDGVPEAHRRGEGARSPQARQGARPLHVLALRAGDAVLPAEGRGDLQRADRLRARVLRPRRLQRSGHAADLGHGALQDLRPLRQLQRQHVLLRGRTSGSTA